MRAALVFAVALGCTAVKSEFQCNYDDAACFLDGRQGQCEATNYCSFEDPSCFDSNRRYGPHSGAYTDLCVGEPLPDDGGTPDMPPGTDEPPPNDQPQSATRIDSSGTYPFDLSNAARDAYVPCGEGSDVFYSFSVFDQEVVYFDTLGSETAIALGHVSADGCRADAATEGWCAQSSCSDFPKGGQLAQLLDPGDYCVAVIGNGAGNLRFIRGGRSGTPANGDANYFDTCMTSNLTYASCAESPGGSGAEEAFYLTTCASTTISAAMTDGTGGLGEILYLRRGWSFSSDLECATGSISAFVDGPALYWVFVEAAGDCGSGFLTISQ